MYMEVFNFLRHLANTQESKVLFILGIIAIAMIIDFVTGTIAAIINTNIEFKSKMGINGILRKICSMLALIIFIPISVIIPENLGLGLIYTLYIGYLMFELKSIVENLGKMGTDTFLFKNILEKINNSKDL